MSSHGHPGRRLVPELLDEFEVRGPNGTHTCYTVTLAACNLRDVSFSLFPLDVARALSHSLAQAVACVHSQGYVHGDLHLNNVLLALPSNFDDLSVEQLYAKYGKPETPLPPNIPAEAARPLLLGRSIDQLTLSTARLLLNDSGEAFCPASEVRLGRDCHTPSGARAPESKFEPGVPLTHRSDIWSLATALWELMGMKPIVAQHIDVLGPMPSDWWLRWKARDEVFITEDGEDKWPPLEERREGNKIVEEEKAAFLDLMHRMLVYLPEERLTADEVLQSDWMVKWALPDYERSLKGST
ncbi:hypothetical protein AO1008_04988 [Aspergillus oryzae 100-8]|nr:hypothetical protein AO1008_04988 [Aspergillus oryzae 100-8]